MRALLFALAVFLAGCSGNQAKEQSSKVDTLTLLDSKPEPNSGEDMFMFNNCIVLFYPSYTVIHEGAENTFTELDAFSRHLQKNAALYSQRKIYVLIDSTTEAKKTVSVLDVLREYKIDNYKVINYKEYFKPPEPVTIQTPSVTTRTAPENDSSLFTIMVLDDGFLLTLLDKERTVKSSEEVDGFIIANKSFIDGNKIRIVSNADVPYRKVKPILDVFGKHGYHKYKLVAK